jgi:hydrogenase expression/formation protein HypC
VCLAIPGLVKELFESDGLKMARVDFCGITRSTCIEYTPQANIGDYVLVHVGFAINLINEEEAQKTYELLKQLGELKEVEISEEEEEEEEEEVN